MQKRFKQLLKELNEGLFEREEAIKLALLTAVAGESIFFLGPPGVAKSLISRRVKSAFKDSQTFEYLMNRFSTPDEIFGPIAISKLKNEDKYERVVKNYLPSADIVFLDEIWKAGPSIQNALLTAINEKKYRNGEQEIDLPLKGLLSASNELPAKGEGLEALWDRFIVRCIVENISDEDNFAKYLQTNRIKSEIDIEEHLKITSEEYKSWQEEISKIEIPDEVIGVIKFIRFNLMQYNESIEDEEATPIYISDRRWKKVVRILQTSAFLNGRKKVNLVDCFLIAYTIWSEVEQIQLVKEYITQAIKEHGYTLQHSTQGIEKAIKILEQDIKNETKIEIKKDYFVPKVVHHNGQEYYRILNYNYPYILKQDYENLIKSNYKEVYLWDSNFWHYYKNCLKKQENHITIQVSLNPPADYQLDVDTKYKKEIQTKRPHKAIIEKWNKDVKNIIDEIDSEIGIINEYRNEELSNLLDNLFVYKGLAKLAEENLYKTIASFENMKKEVEKIKLGYEKL